jgi:tyrosine aminotransferase
VSVLVNPGDNILIPNPGFALYQVLTEAIGGEVRKYNLLPASNWECDLVHMESLITDRTKAILINNPSNPCGSNFSREHLVQVAALAKKHGLPVIADEIYAGVVFNGTFTAVHEVTSEVPIFSVGGIAKEFVVPGWRVGWVVVHDRTEGAIASDVMAGLKSLSQLILGANSIVQATLPRLLSRDATSPDYDSLKTFNTRYCEILRVNADLCCTEIARCNRALSEISKSATDLLSISKPAGAMYAMIGIDMTQLDQIPDDAEFARLFLHEENVSVLPGICFGMKNYVRFVICPSDTILQDAFNRLLSFCTRHLKASGVALSSPMKNIQG